MGKKFFDYSDSFGGKSYKDLTPEEKKEYRKNVVSNFNKTRVRRVYADMYTYKEEDMMILYFLDNVVSNRQSFIKRVLWEYILNNAPEYVDKLGEFKFDHDVEQRVYNRVYEYNGVQNTLCGWANLLGAPYDTLKQRLNKNKWSVEKAFTEPIKAQQSNGYNGRDIISKEDLIELTEKIKSGEIKFPIKNDNKRPKQRDYSGIKFATKNKCTKDITLEELNNETFKDVLYKREVVK